MKSQRRRDLLRILRNGRASSQEDIVEALRANGHDVTQATVSRDLREVGAVKTRVGSRLIYRLADDADIGTSDVVARNLQKSLAEFSIDIKAASSLVVITTLPGHAEVIARAIDLAGTNDAVGTVAGDDTIFVATPSPRAATRLVQTLEHLTQEEPAS